MRQQYLVIVICWICFVESSYAQLLTVFTQFSVETPLLAARGTVSSPLVISLTNAGADAVLEDHLSAWQVSLAILPDAGANGALTFYSALQPDASYIFPAGTNLGLSAIISGNELLAFDTNFPFSGGVELPADLETNLLELRFLSSSDAAGSFGLYALAGIGSSEWTDSTQPIQARRQFNNIPDSGGPVRIGDILITQPGDFGDDVDGVLNALDIDDLTGQSASGDNNLAYDLNADSLVDATDINVWVRDLFDSWIGDANLDREFNSSDLVDVLAAGTYEVDVDSVWSSGDFNGNGRTDSSDLVAALADGGYEKGTRPALAVVPEPSGGILLAIALPFLIRRRRN